MTPPKVLLCNYTGSEEKAWRFLLRGFPMLEVSSVPAGSFGCPLYSMTGRYPVNCMEPPMFTGRMVIFVGAQGELLKKLIDISNQVTKAHAFRAIMTEENRSWTFNTLYNRLQAEEQSLKRK